MDTYTFKLLGKASISREETVVTDLPTKAQELLFFLIIHNSRVHTREQLASHLWPESSNAQSRKYMRQMLWCLQSNLSDGVVETQPILLVNSNWVQFNRAAPAYIDIGQFERVFESVRALPDNAISRENAALMLETIRLYEAELLQGWYVDWCLPARERYHSMYLLMVDKLMHHCLYQGDFDTGIALGLGTLQFDRAREKTHRRLMRLFHASGDRTSALRQFEVCASAMATEFNLPPSERTVRLYEQLRSGSIGTWQPAYPQSTPPRNELSIVLDEIVRLHATVAALRAEVKGLTAAVEQSHVHTADVT